LFRVFMVYRDKKVVGVFVPRFRAPLQSCVRLCDRASGCGRTPGADRQRHAVAACVPVLTHWASCTLRCATTACIQVPAGYLLLVRFSYKSTLSGCGRTWLGARDLRVTAGLR
jgi:hypothetical protein